MKKYFDGSTSLEDLKDSILRIQNRDDRKVFYTWVAIITGVLVAVIIATVVLLKNKMNDDFDDDWDCDWDDFDDEEYCCNDDCCCTDNDIDTSVKVEKL